ncbi:MAG TPA: class I SAM-dependent methyltransferase [Candidatus Omnitrophota bacterium]|nr:class I SAM-dependent methyltransferase [Candidatus Omnitrophota bacterium]HQL40760.1 class I SAM-dependent methyltransferase [Candidatus Omnitrophota bacterium]
MKDWFSIEKRKQRSLKDHGYDIVRSRDFILQKAKIGKGSLLEIGTGKGHFTLALARRNFLFTAIDLDASAQKVARQYLRRYGLENMVAIRKMNAEKLSFSNQSFDIVISVNFMHHAQKPFLCLREMVRVAKKKIVIADINQKGAQALDRFHANEGRQHPRSHVSLKEVRSFFQKSGFTVKTYKGYCQTVLVARKGE